MHETVYWLRIRKNKVPCAGAAIRSVLLILPRLGNISLSNRMQIYSLVVTLFPRLDFALWCDSLSVLGVHMHLLPVPEFQFLGYNYSTSQPWPQFWLQPWPWPILALPKRICTHSSEKDCREILERAQSHRNTLCSSPQLLRVRASIDNINKV
jgi:hypothetical protein